MSNQGKRAHNFNAGPSALPLEVLQQAQKDLVDYQGKGLSIMEMSHRSEEYFEAHNGAIDAIKRLLDLPDNYHVLLLQGGASLQFGMLAMNLLTPENKATYLMTGSWSEKALKDAQKVGNAEIGATTKEENYARIPSANEIKYNGDDAYVHLTSNNTIFGTQWPSFPDTGDVPLIADMSSDIFSRPFDITKFGMIYAGAQKNLGPSGVTLVIIRDDLVQKGADNLPAVLQYRIHADSNSLHNTPPTFPIYMLSLVMKWLEARGGIKGVQKQNEEKAALIYNTIDESNGYYTGHAEKDSRSLMNVTFRLPTVDLEKKFLAEASDQGLVGLNGHRSVGGCRASIYNSVSLESCQVLKEFMVTFQRDNG